MRIQYVAPLLLLTICSSVSGQTPKPASSATHRNYKLVNLQNNKTDPKTTDDEIKAMVASFHNDFGPVFALETGSGDQPLTMDQVGKGKFCFTCQDGNLVYIMTTGHECSADVAIKIIISYRDATADWKKLADWDQVKQDQLKQ